MAQRTITLTFTFDDAVLTLERLDAALNVWDPKLQNGETHDTLAGAKNRMERFTKDHFLGYDRRARQDAARLAVDDVVEVT